MQLEDAGDNTRSEKPEGAGNNEDSLLGDLSPLSDDVSPMALEEYDAWCRKVGGGGI
jgi:hypothetical protein